MERFKKYFPELVLLFVMLGGIAAMTYTSYTQRQLYPDASELPYQAFRKILGVIVITIVAGMGAMYLVLSRRIARQYKTQSWLINVLRSQGKKSAVVELGTTGNLPQSTPVQGWPWGSHHTEYLGHLDAAARKFWVLYDPSDPTTAPTNETVSEWLRSERNLSREKARAIASMLRPDGLPTGPRQ